MEELHRNGKEKGGKGKGEEKEGREKGNGKGCPVFLENNVGNPRTKPISLRCWSVCRHWQL